MLDQVKTYKTYDKEDVAFGIERLSEQVRIAWTDARHMQFSKKAKKVERIVVVGMGGSALGVHALTAAFKDELTKPVEIVRDYSLPGYVGAETLVVLSSFSGATQEVLHAAREARKRKAEVVVVTTGGPLARRAKRHGWALYQFDPGELAKQPRLGVGFSLAALLRIFNTLSIITVKDEDVHRMVEAMHAVVDTCALDIPTKENPAKTVAHALQEAALVIVGSEHLEGNAHIFQNQICETAKQFAQTQNIPELNHFFMEGLMYPAGLTENMTALFLRSKLYRKQNQLRHDVTAELFEKQGVHVVDYATGGGSRLEEVGEVLQFSTFVSYYLGMINKVHPTDIPHVKWFKEQMKQR